MDFTFLYEQIIPKIHLFHYNFFSFYEGFDNISFLSKIINNIKNSNSIGSTYLINYSNLISDSISQYNINIQTKIDEKKKQYSKEIYSISKNVMLSNLISYKISKDSVAAIIFSEKTLLINDSKALFIIKLISSYSKIIVVFICNNQYFFSENVKYFMNIINPNYKEINFEFIPRFNKVINRIISYNFQSKSLIENEEIVIEEYNLEFEDNNPLFQIQENLKKLLSIIIKEICNYIQCEKYNDELYKYFEKYLILDFYNKDKYKIFFEFNPKIEALFLDLENVKSILKGIDSFDLNIIFFNFKKLQRKSDDRFSIFSYLDSETEQIINNINNLLKNSIYKIQSRNNILEDDKNLIKKFLDDKIIKDLSVNENFVEEKLFSYQIILNENIFDFIYKKYNQLIDILLKLDKEKKENILIIVKNDITKNNIKQILISKFILNDNFHSFFISKMGRILFSKEEYLKRIKTISNNQSISNIYIEQLMLHFLSYKILISRDEKNENNFEKILQNSDSIKKDLLPSEIAELLTEEDYAKFDETFYNEDNIIKNKHIEILTLNHKNFSENSIELKNTLNGRNYHKIILFNTMIDILRFLECFIIENESSINSIINLNVINSYSFNSQISLIKYEFDTFVQNITFQKEYIEISNKKENENGNNIEKKKKEHISNILIDDREIYASTPFYLYQQGFNINIARLEVGDYILSNSVCVERKSISTGDIFQSLITSHLTDQIIKMINYYEFIVLLLEFENFEDITTIIHNGHLFNQNELYRKFLGLKNIKNDSENNKIILIWSLSPKMTAEIFMNLKRKYNDQFLDIQKCINMNKIKKKQKKQNLKDINEIEEKKERIMISLLKFLLRIDGIDNSNIKSIFNSFKNLNEFIQLPKEQLYEKFGRINGNKINLYINKNFIE